MKSKFMEPWRVDDGPVTSAGLAIMCAGYAYNGTSVPIAVAKNVYRRDIERSGTSDFTREIAHLIASAPDLLGLLIDIASIIDTTDSEHPAFMDSGADSIALLWELNGRLRATIRQANGGAA